MNMLYHLLERSAAAHPEGIALVFQQHAIRYREFKDATDRLAAGLQSIGLAPGDRLALMLPNLPHFCFALYAAFKAGVTVVPLSVSLRADEIHRRLEDAEAKGIVYFEKNRTDVFQAVQGLERCRHLLVLGEKARPGEIRLNYLMESNEPSTVTADIAENDTAFVVYTGGLSGHIKGAELTHANLASNAEACSEFLRLTCSDGVAGPIPFTHPIGVTLVLNAFLVAGAKTVLLPRFNAAETLSAVADQGLTHFIGVPAMFAELAALPEAEIPPLPTLKTCVSTGDSMRQDIMDAFESRYRAPVLEGYGLTEASPMVSFTSPARERRAGSIGLPLPGVDLKIVGEDGREVLPGQVGEIVVQGPNVMKGYLNRPEATREALRDGWLRTGDLARLDESGFGFIVVRKKNVIVKSGFSVYPVEVERYLEAHPKIQEVVVVGLPDPAQGEEIHACAVVKAGETAAEREILDYARERMAMYKCPKSVLFVAALPKGPTGRVLRDKVKLMLLERSKEPTLSQSKGGVS
jgi:long-chain acyl-CoA synthetase